MYRLLIVFMIIFSSHAFSGSPGLALSMVPKGKLADQSGRDFIVKTEAGTKIQIEFKRNGQFEEAKGMNLNKGDYLEPGEGLISLSSAAHILVSKGVTPQGTWHLDNDEKHGWVYEFENTLIDAKSGKVIAEETPHLVKKAASIE